MIDISSHYISIDPALLMQNWERYRDAYRSIEDGLPRFSSVASPFTLETHPLGGFFVSRRNVCDSPLQRLFENPSGQFLLVHSGKHYSRGLAYYPGLHAEKTNNEKISFIIRTLCRIAKTCEEERHAPRTSVVYGAIALDYARNYLLILLHAVHLMVYRQNLIANDLENADRLNNQLKALLIKIEVALFQYITTDHPVLRFPDAEVLGTLKDVRYFLKKYEENINQDFDGKKLIREVREMDSLVHIYLFALKLAEQHLTHDSILIGLEYGGIELPFAVNAVRIMMGKQRICETTLHVSHYSHRLFVPGAIEDLIGFKTENDHVKHARHVWVLDDSITTGRSIRTVTKLLDKTVKTYVCAVAFKVSNRYHHLIMESHGGFSPVVARHSLILCQANYSSTYRRDSYLNRSGVFDVNKHNLYKMLGRELL